MNDVRLEPWGEADLPLLRRLVGDPAMMEHLGGPESEEKIVARQARYVPAGSNQFRIVAGGEAVGWVGYWERDWNGEKIREIGWAVLPAFQGRGIARAATEQAIALARAEDGPRGLHAFPSVDNPPSNQICRTLGFTLVEAHDLEFPPGSFMRCNDWRLDLTQG